MNTITLAIVLFGSAVLVLADIVPHAAYGPPATASVLLPIAVPAPAENKILPSQAVHLSQGQVVDIRDASGQYSHGYSGNDGTKLSEQGSLLSTNDGWETVIVKKGSYSYVSPEGKQITVNYVADDKGFRAVGDHIPK
ncbi:endocuticle structural protein SgAbd-6 [Anabrus simplex]|uniref:endocuticle structural protein SgAbd-6 n=1 Tax=Anabrus simplex TaxID=316456 RepID=UPI0035A30F1B